jgi:gas vesicle protein
VLLGVPFGALGALLGVWLRGLPSDIYFQVGLITVVGLAAKNAILIVEFANEIRGRGVPLREAAVEAARERFRPILMTSFAFILGVSPLVIASGAGAGIRSAPAFSRGCCSRRQSESSSSPSSSGSSGDWPSGVRRAKRSVWVSRCRCRRRQRRGEVATFQTDPNEASLMKTEETPAEFGEDTSTTETASRTGAGFLAGIVFGVFLGAGIALFLASDRGDKTRNKLRRRMRSLGKDALEGLDRAGSRTRDELRRRQRRIRAELDRIRERAKQRAKEAREALE